MELIDRQAAIDAINEIIRMEHSLRPKVYVAKDAIKKLPSVQPTFDARDTQYNLPIGTDLISRQAVIKAITDNADKICDCMYSDGTVKDDVVAVVLDLIDTVPTVCVLDEEDRSRH
jgi:hypothetical protein